MKPCQQNLINRYALLKLKYDFMGYPFKELCDLSFHHLIIPRNISFQKGFQRGYYEWNGVMLGMYTSHEYLHVIERKDYERFLAITSELLDECFKGRLSIENLLAIDDILSGFEREFTSFIKQKYTERAVKKGAIYIYK